MDTRALRERAFHDEAYRKHPRAVLDNYYRFARSSAARYEHRIGADSTGKSALEIGCGEGAYAAQLESRGAKVTAIDISEVAVDLARARAGVKRSTISFQVMNAERMGFADESFDLVCGRSILHHLDLRRGLGEVSRVLRPTGRAVFLEPLGHNPILNLWRWATPRLRSQDERPLRMSDIRMAGQHFGRVHADYYHLASLAGIALERMLGASRLHTFLEAVDRRLLLTPLRRYAWIVVLTLEEPGSAG